jgi:hypothetical protein
MIRMMFVSALSTKLWQWFCTFSHCRINTIINHVSVEDAYCRKILNIFLGAFKTGKKSEPLAIFLGLFFSEYKINPFFFRECMYIVFILQCEKVQNHCQSLVERAETNIILIIFKCVL